MCLLGIAFRAIQGFPLALLANREEAYAREALPPGYHPACPKRPAWMGGLDRHAGGTWLGVNARGLVVAVTNRPRAQVPELAVSRGLLCRALLGCENATAAMALCHDRLASGSFAGCNFLIADTTKGAMIEYGDVPRTTELSPGLHFITNGAFNDPADLRIRRVRDELHSTSPEDIDRWIVAAQRVCALSATTDRAAVCVIGRDRGTVSSTVVALPQSGHLAVYRHADGPPSTTPYRDFSDQLRSLLAQQHSRAPGHRIALRGPWQYELLVRRDAAAESAIGVDAPARGVVQMPATCRQLFGNIGGRARFARGFHRPTNLAEGNRLLLTFQGVGGFGTASLNGHWLGALSELEPCQCFDGTDYLERRNLLEIELDFEPPPDRLSHERAPGGLGGPVAIEIVSDDAANRCS